MTLTSSHSICFVALRREGWSPPSPRRPPQWMDGQAFIVALAIQKHIIVYGRLVLKVVELDSLMSHTMTLLEGTDEGNAGHFRVFLRIVHPGAERTKVN